MEEKENVALEISRRDFLKTVAAVSAATAIGMEIPEEVLAATESQGDGIRLYVDSVELDVES